MIRQVVNIVKEAAQIMLRHDFSIRSKAGYADIVTTADLEVQHLLCRRLKELLPASGFLCEEEDVLDTAHDDVWVIDPIDGTANFSRGIPECAISVALKRRGRIVLGVVYNPFRRDLFTAQYGRGARRNGRLIHVSERPVQDGLFCTALCVYHKEYAGRCDAVIQEAIPQCNDVRRFGSCALEICYLAAGLCEFFFEYRVCAWDYAAAFLVLSEAGGILTDRDGLPPAATVPTVLVGANGPANHAWLLSIVQKHVPPQPYDL